jgi:hypothetical protein
VKLAGNVRAVEQDASERDLASGQAVLVRSKSVLRIGLIDGFILVPEVNVAGGKGPMDAASFYRGYLMKKPTELFA